MIPILCLDPMNLYPKALLCFSSGLLDAPDLMLLLCGFIKKCVLKQEALVAGSPVPHLIGFLGPKPRERGRRLHLLFLSPGREIGSKLTVSKKVSTCIGRTRYIRSLEHVQVRISLSYSRRGDLAISLTSPMGTKSTLVAIR